MFSSARSWNRKPKRSIEYVNSDNEDADDPEAIEDESNLLASYKSENKKSRFETQVDVRPATNLRDRGDARTSSTTRENVFFVSKYFAKQDDDDDDDESKEKASPPKPDLSTEKHKRHHEANKEEPSAVKSKTKKDGKRQSKIFGLNFK